MEAWAAVVGTLLGGLLGALGGYFTQASQHRREAKERRVETRRVVYAAWLSELHEYFAALNDVTGKYRHQPGAPQLAAELRSVSPQRAQVSLEEVRLVGGQKVTAAAARQWELMRRHDVPTGRYTRPDEWGAWRDQYWDRRRAFLDAARAEFGLPPLDWVEAGVGPNVAKRSRQVPTRGPVAP